MINNQNLIKLYLIEKVEQFDDNQVFFLLLNFSILFKLRKRIFNIII